MSITQNEKISQVKDTTLVVGIDISSETHYARAFDWRGLELAKVFKCESASYGFENFLNGCLNFVRPIKRIILS